MNYKNVLIGVFAILVGALILDLPIVGAVQVNIMRPVGSNWVQHDQIVVTPGNLIGKTISVQPIGGIFPWTDAKIIMNITNTTATELEAVYVYKCGDLSPTECVETETPDMYTILNNDLDMEMLWNDMSHVTTQCSTNPSSCLETTNIFFLFKINDNGKVIWVGKWNNMERRTESFAEPYLYEYDISEIDLHTEINFLTLAKNFISMYLSLPLNPQWVSGAVFQGADSIYEISASSSDLQQSSPIFQIDNHTSNEVRSISEDYSFVFAETSYGVLNPVTLKLNPSFNCGDDICDTVKGESSANCCYDCPCSSGYYCDGGTEGNCKLESLISLGLYEVPDTSVTNCNEQHIINITVEVNNAPSDMDLTRTEYRLDNITYTTLCEEITTNVYECTIIVPAMPDCHGGEYSIGPNYLEFGISYSDGPGSGTKNLITQFPNIVVGSFTCGQDGCQSGLGENSDNCCYDCGCSQGYCDIEDSAQPSTGICKHDINVGNLYATASPTHFYTHNDAAGDIVNLMLEINNAPANLDITESSCEIACTGCSVYCDVSCSEITSSDPSVFNASCLLTFIIGSYDSTNDYSLSPTLNLSVSYNNGSSGDITKTLTKPLNTISVGSSWCGDNVCAPNENQLNCCYDCGCSDGYYCDTTDINAPTAGDSCKPERGIRLVVDGVETNTFDYHDISHYTILAAHVENAPSSLEGVTSCMFGNGSYMYCNMVCERSGDNSTSHMLQCNLSIPVIDYKISPFYNPSTKKITIGPNTMNYSVTYNNGSGLVSKELSTDFSDININVKSRCGSGAGYFGVVGERCMPYNRTLACETDLGESSANCCCDCPCPTGRYCLIGGYGNGQCADIGSISLTIDDIEPNPIECEIDETRRLCTFSKQLNIQARIEPAANYTIVSTIYEMDDKKQSMSWSCIYTSTTPPWNTYNCSVPLAPLQSTNLQEGTIRKSFELSMDIESIGLLHTTIKENGTFQMKRTDSDAVELMDKKIELLKSQKRSMKTIKNVIWGVLAVAAGFCTAACIWSFGVNCGQCWIIFACLASALLPMITSILGKMTELEAQLMVLEAARNPGEIYDVQVNTAAVWLQVIGVIAGIVCLIGMMNGGFGAKSANPIGMTRQTTWNGYAVNMPI
jgi:hypothetical protein